MRLFTKIFLFGMLVFGLAFSASGYFLLHYSLESSMAREADFALKQFQYDKFTVQSAMLTYTEVSVAVSFDDSFFRGEPGDVVIWQVSPEEIIIPKGAILGEGTVPEAGSILEGEAVPEAGSIPEGGAVPGVGSIPEGGAVPGGEGIPEGEALSESQSSWDGLTKQFFANLAEEISVPVAFFSEDKTPLYSEIEGLDTSFLDSLSEDAHVYRFWGTPEGAGISDGTPAAGSVLVGTVLDWNVLDGNVLDGSALEGSILDGSALEGSILDGSALEGSILEGSILDWSTMDGNALDGSVLGGNALDGNVPDGDVHGTEAGAGNVAEETADIPKDSQRIYFVTQWDISKTVSQQETLRQYFVRCYLAAVAMSIVLLGVLSALLTGPLKRMSKAARRMAEGYYEERLMMSGRDEIGELAESFNQMAGAVEEKIGELSRAAREKEDFVANFAHELKTPLTSIIGYADTIYQKDLPRETVRRASWHIWNEGMRLEALSLKLMELTVLGRQEFPLQEMSAEELLADVAESMAPVFSEKQVVFGLEAEPAYIRADCDLLKTLLLNLLDNSVKAGGRRLELSGHRRGGRYQIRVRDDGCGMEEAELSRITEAFYMVDKARSRRQHGAGLGLALADRIAGVHGSRLSFQSRKGAGTEVSFDVECGKGGVEDEEI